MVRSLSQILSRSKQESDQTLIMTLLDELARVTLQKRVPVGEGRVLGRYSSPLLTLNSYNRHD